MTKRNHKSEHSLRDLRRDHKEDEEQAKKMEQSEVEKIENYVSDKEMLDLLEKKNIKKLFPIQYMTYKAIYDGEDIVGRDRTGSGKTLAFSLPIITRLRQKSLFSSRNNHGKSVKFLIIEPTRELAIQVKDQIKSLRKSGEDFDVGAIYGGAGMSQQIDLIKKGVDILVATPGRLIDFCGRNIVNMKQIKAICLDEADQMLNMGFKEDIQKIFKYTKSANPKKTQNLLFSATIPEWIWSISKQYQQPNCKYINLVKNHQIQASTTVKNYKLSISRYDREAMLSKVIRYFLGDKEKKKIIIFCETKRDVERIKILDKIPYRNECLHGDVKQFARERVYRMFKGGYLQCIIATNVAARGLDFPNIDLIIQMQPPKTTDSYIHRAGRTGRAGMQGICVTFYGKQNSNFMEKIIKESKIDIEDLDINLIKAVTPAKDTRKSYSEENYNNSKKCNDSNYRDQKSKSYQNQSQRDNPSPNNKNKEDQVEY